MFKHILLATDGSVSAEHAAHKALELARIHGAQITAVCVVDPYPYVGIGEDNPAGFQSYMSAAQAAATHTFTHLERLAKAVGVPLKTWLVEDTQVVQGILMVADEAQSDLIVVGSHGRHGVQRLILGSVAQKVVAQSTRPVLVVR